MTLPASPMTSNNHNLDNLKCSECGKNGHFQNQCSDNLKCFECGKNMHFQNQFPNNKLFASTQTSMVLSTSATTNLEVGNMPKLDGSMILSTPSSNRYLDNVKCFQCGKNGHYQIRCPERKSDNVNCFECGKSGHYQDQCLERKSDDVKCFECGKRGHYQRQCPKRKRPFSAQAYETLLTAATTNLEAPTTSSALPMTPDNNSHDSLKYCERGKKEHFQNQYSDNKVSAPMQVDALLPTVATTNLEVPPSSHSTPFESSKVIDSSSIFGAPINSSFGAGAANSPVCSQSSTLAFDAGATSSPVFEQSITRAFDSGAASSLVFCQSSTPAFDAGAANSSVFVQSSAPAFGISSTKHGLFGSTSTSACDFQNTSSLCGSSSSPAFGSGYYTSAFKISTLLAPAFGTTGTSPSMQQSTTIAVGLHSNQSSPLVNNHAISSSTLFGVPSQYAFGIPHTPVFGQSSTSVMGKAGSTPTLFGSTATSTSTSAFGSRSNMSYLFGTSSNSFGSQMTPENQTLPPENQMSAPECQTTTPVSQTGITDQQKSIETPYCSTQDTCGKSVSILDKITFRDKNYEELNRDDYHGCDREQVQAWGQSQSSPFDLANMPKTDDPQLPVVVTSENNKGSGDTPYVATKTSVWWDIENCQVPRGNSDTYYIAQNISSALADAGYKGAVTISAYGDTHKIPIAVQQALSSTGIALNHVPAGVKDASDKKILVDMLFWAVDNPPPANYLLISGDRDFSNALHQLRLRRYNILLAHAPPVSQALVAAAKKVWQWPSLLSGGPPLQDLESGTKASSSNKSRLNAIKGPMPKRVRWQDQNAIQVENHSCFPGVSKPETSENTRLDRAPISSPSHEIACSAKRPRNSVDCPEQMPLKSTFCLGNEKNPLNSQPFKLCQLFPPSNTNSYSSITQPNYQCTMFGPPHLLSMQDKSERYNDNQNNRHNIGHIVNALTELRANKIAPTEENISNCIHYGMGTRSFDVKIALDYACENNVLTRYNLDDGTLFYLGKNEQFWEFVNVLDVSDKHSEETWNSARNFLSSASGRSAISSTECRYHAGTVLKKACLQHLALGEVLQLLNTVIKFRKWIVPSSSGWQPLSFTLKVIP